MQPAHKPAAPHFVLWASLIFAAALLLRLEVSDRLAASLLGAAPIGDAAHYDSWARALVLGRAPAPPDYMAPLWAWVLAGWYAVLGVKAQSSALLLASLGAGSSVLMMCAARRLFSPAAGLAAGLFACCYAPSLAHGALLEKSALELFLASALVACVAELLGATGVSPRTRASAWLGSGLLLGLLTLARENALLLLPLLLLFAASERAQPGRRLRHALLLLIPLALVLLPVCWRNARAGGSFAPSWNAGINLYLGNALDGQGSYAALRDGREAPRTESGDARALAEAAEGRALEPREISRWFLGAAFEAVRADPRAWLERVGQKALKLAAPDEAMDSFAPEALAAESGVLRACAHFAHFGSLLALGLLGLCWARTRWREVWLLPAGAAVLALSLLAVFVLGRYRLVLVPWLMPFAGAALAQLCGLLWARRWPAWWRGLAALAALGLPLFCLGLRADPSTAQRVSTTWSNLCSELTRRSSLREALRAGEQSVAAEDSNAAAHYNLASALLANSEPARAVEHYARAAALGPAWAAEAFEAAGLACVASQQNERAGEFFAQATQVRPSTASAHYHLGLWLRQQGDYRAARQAYTRALELDSRENRARINLAFVSAEQGEVSAALALYQAALAQEPDSLPALQGLVRWLSSAQDARLRDGPQALRLGERAAALGGWRDPLSLDLLAMARAECGDYAGAQTLAQNALDLARGSAREELARGLAQRLTLYSSGRPWREGR